MARKERISGSPDAFNSSGGHLPLTSHSHISVGNFEKSLSFHCLGTIKTMVGPLRRDNRSYF